jgi:deoxyribonuclease V
LAVTGELVTGGLPGWPWPADADGLERLQIALAAVADAALPWDPTVWYAGRAGQAAARKADEAPAAGQADEAPAAGQGGGGSVSRGVAEIAAPKDGLPPDPLVAGVYVTYPSGVGGPGSAGEPMWAAAVLMQGGEVLAEVVERGLTGGPYAAGLLALRCGTLLERAVRALPQRADLLVVDATGRDHPRRAGLALHLGAVLEVPSVGFTNRVLLAAAAPVEDRRGAASPLLLAGEFVGYAVRTASGVNPLHAHAAWRTTPDLARCAALSLTNRWRTPEPLRRARTLARLARAEDEGRLPG